MDEENMQNNKPKSNAADVLKKLGKTAFKKIPLKVKFYLLIGILALVLLIVICVAIGNFLDILGGSSAKEASSAAVTHSQGSSSENPEDEEVLNQIIVDISNVTENGTYILKYQFKDEDGNILTEEQALANIKRDLLNENKELDTSVFTKSELKIIGALMYNGLIVEQFNEEELQALAMFQKVDIAAQYFDLRTEEQSERILSLEELRESDEIYGTIKAYKTKVGTDSEGKATYEKEMLGYTSFDNFNSMVNQENEDIVNKFTIDADGNLLVARKIYVKTTYEYVDENNKKLSQEDMKKIPEHYILENKESTTITTCPPIEYERKIRDYIIDFGFLSDLLIATKNVDFCLELAKIALDSKIVININEELTINESNSIVDIEVEGEKEEFKKPNNNTIKPIYIDETTDEVIEYEKQGEKITFKRKSFTHSERYSYSFEISEVDCWYAKYKVEYGEPTIETESIGSTTRTEYKFGEQNADTTEVYIKNVEYVNDKRVYTPEGIDGEPEIGFLSIYDKYLKSGVDLLLQDDSETKLFQMLESDRESKAYAKSNIIKDLLFVYDGIDRGGTTLKPSIGDLNQFRLIQGTSTELFIKAWENGTLYLYTTGQSDHFPVGYLSDDEQYYICYEDGSAGHNNIAYGMTTYVCSEERQEENHPIYGKGYYCAEETYLAAGIVPRELYEGAYVDKEAADSVFYGMIEGHMNGTSQHSVNNILKNELPGYEFSQAQKDALCSISWQYGSIQGFDEVYKRAVKEDGTFDPEIIAEFKGMHYKEDSRQYANWLLFTTGKYIDYRGEEIVVRKPLNNWDGETYSNDKYTFPIYEQNDQRWGTYPYGGPNGLPSVPENKGKQKTIHSSGCGSCALAMILSGYVGEAITPDMFVQFLDEKNTGGTYYSPGVGSSELGVCAVLEEFGCSYEYIDQDKEKAIEALKNGYAVLGGQPGHVLAYVPVSSEDAAQGYVFKILDSAVYWFHHDFLCVSFEDAEKQGLGTAYATCIIYPPEYEQDNGNSQEKNK